MVLASLFGLVVSFAASNPEFLSVRLGGYFGELTGGGAMAVGVLCASGLLFGVKLTTHDTRSQQQGYDSSVNRCRVSNPFNK